MYSFIAHNLILLKKISEMCHTVIEIVKANIRHKRYFCKSLDASNAALRKTIFKAHYFLLSTTLP